MALVAMTGLLTGVAANVVPAFAATPVTQLDARWADGTPDELASGDVATVEWRINVNDAEEPPENEPVDNVSFTATVMNGEFSAVPAACLTKDVQPVSSLSADGSTLFCNVGTKPMGTAIAVQTVIVATGTSGEDVAVSGSTPDATAEVDPIPIVSVFGMDINWDSPSNWTQQPTPGVVDLDFQWTLNLLRGSEPGPQSVSYTVTLNASTGATLQGQGCGPFAAANGSGHPWSGGAHPSEQVAPFVGSCSLTPTSTPNVFTMTLTGIDYSLSQVPTEDSSGSRLPVDRSAIASGRVVFRLMTSVPTSVALSSSTPTYVSAVNATTQAIDDSQNNSSSKTWTPSGTWNASWIRSSTGAGGTNWDDSYRVAPQTEVLQQNASLLHNGGLAAGTSIGQCSVIDTRHLEFTSADSVTWSAGNPVVPFEAAALSYYVGTDARLDPASSSYDPQSFSSDCSIDAGSWTSTLPADPGLVKAVRSTYRVDDASANDGVYLRVRAVIKADAPVGADVWALNSYRVGNAAWAVDSTAITPTPGALYSSTTPSRDILRIINVSPHVEKSVDRSQVLVGENAVFSINYSANGGTAAPETVDGFGLRDVLPPGMTYVPGSATPEPTLTTTADGQQVLTWTFDDVATNVVHSQTYQARAEAGVEPGAALTNVVVASLDGRSSAPTSASVAVVAAGYTTIVKTADKPFIPNIDGDGTGSGSWTVTVASRDTSPQGFTDVIDVLPYTGDGRGTDFSGDYSLTAINAPGATVYYTTADPVTLSDDPAHGTNGAAGDPTGNTVGWSTTFTPNATAVRVIGPRLAPGATQQFQIEISTDGVEGGDVLVNRAQARAEHTELVMRTSAPITVANYYSASLKKYVQNADGEWHDANDVTDYPSYRPGDTVPYRIVIENTGQGTLTDLEITDDLFPEGSFTVAELVPGEEEVHEFEIVLEDGGLDTVVNTACGSAAIPDDSGVAPTINCDPAGLEVEGDPTHTKSLVSATPIGNGQWELVYGLDVSNTSTASTSYSLDDALHFTGQADIVSAEVTSAPDGVTLADPAWDGRGETRIATDVQLAGTDDAGYAPHEYVLTVIATVPLQLENAGGSPDPTACGPDGGDSDTAFNNTSALTDAAGEVEEDQACAPIPSIDIVKVVSDGPTPNGDGTWTVLYDLVVTNDGAGSGSYDLTDTMNIDGDIVVESAEVVSAPDGVDTSDTWTGDGTAGSPENVITTGIVLAAGGTHTYGVQVVISLDGADGAPVATECQTGGPGGLSNTAGVGHNGLEDSDDACITVGSVTVEKTISDGPTPNGDGSWSITYHILAENLGAAEAEYEVSDRLEYGEGIDITDATVSAPNGVMPESSWTGLGADGADENVIASGVTLAAGATHLYQVVVTFELADDVDPSALECQPGSAGGLANSTSVVHNGIEADDSVCASVPLIEFTKEIADGPTPNGDGTWTITYDLGAVNVGGAPGDYDLTDRLQYGDGIVIESADVVSTPQGVADPSGWTGQGAEGADVNVVAEGESLDAGETHTYQVAVVVSLDLDVVTPVDLACAPDGEPGSGLFNAAQLTHNGESIDDEACAPLPLIDIVKSLSGAVTPVDGQDGVYDATYEITVTNRGPGAGQYDLDDELSVGEGVDVVGIQDVTTDAPNSVGINPGFDGVDDIRIVTAQPVAAAAGAPVVHTYTVVVRYAVNLSGIEVPAGDACTDGDGEALPGTLSNDATVVWNGIEDSDDECVRPGQPTLDKAIVSATPIGDGQWEVVYDLTVGNTGTEATSYDLDDRFRFAPAIGVDSATVTGPGGVEIDDAFDGAGNTRIATDVTIAGLDDEGYAPHVYRVTVVADVPLDLPDTEEDGTGAPGCTLPGGSNTLEQGLNNVATLTDENGNEVTDTDCASVPEIGIDKSVLGKPTRADNGDWTVRYEIVVSNAGAATGEYTLADRLRFGAGIKVEDAAVTAAPEGVTVSDSWTGEGAEGDQVNVISTDVRLAAGENHTYRVQVTASIDVGATDGTTFACPEPGTDGRGGFANTAGVGHNGLAADDEACVPPTASSDVPPLAITGTDVMRLLGAAAILLVVGLIVTVMARRRIEA